MDQSIYLWFQQRDIAKIKGELLKALLETKKLAKAF